MLRLPGGVEATIAVSGADTDGRFTLITDEAPPGWSLPPHRHLDASETITIVSGALWFELDGERSELHAHDTVHVPAGTLHTGGTLGDEPVRRAVVFSPAGMDELFTALAEVTDPAEGLELAQRHGWRFD